MVRLSTVVFASLFTAVLSQTAAQVGADITVIQTDVNKLDTDVNAFPAAGPGTLAQALLIHSDATTLNTAVQKATTDAKATPPLSEADGQTILGQIQAIEPTIVDALNGIVARKAAFAALPIGNVVGLVRVDLATLNASTVAFENALVAIAPADLLSSAQAIITEINNGFANAIAAYAT